jgi:hypothetical protein
VRTVLQRSIRLGLLAPRKGSMDTAHAPPRASRTGGAIYSADGPFPFLPRGARAILHPAGATRPNAEERERSSAATARCRAPIKLARARLALLLFFFVSWTGQETSYCSCTCTKRTVLRYTSTCSSTS